MCSKGVAEVRFSGISLLVGDNRYMCIENNRFPEKVQRAFVFLLCFVKPSGESLEEASVAISHICTVEYPFDVVVRIVDSSK